MFSVYDEGVYGEQCQSAASLPQQLLHKTSLNVNMVLEIFDSSFSHTEVMWANKLQIHRDGCVVLI